MTITEKHKTLFYYVGLFVITACPFINFLTSPSNILEASYVALSFIFLAILLIGFVFCGLLQKIFKFSPFRTLILYFFIFYFVLYYQVLIENFVKLVHFDSFLVLTYIKKALIALIACVLGILLVLKLSRSLVFQQGFLIFVFFSFLFSIGQFLILGFSVFQRVILYERKPAQSSFSFKSKPNIYFFLIDAYPRHDTLLPEWDNTPFLDFFKTRGFIVGDKAYANYSYTWPSLTATFQMNYLNPGDVVRSDVLSPLKEVFVTLKSNNYKIATVPSPYRAFSGRNIATQIFVRHSFLPYVETISHFFGRTFLAPLMNQLMRFSYFSMEEIKNVTTLDKSAPWFVFIHFTHFHDFVFDDKCNISSKKNPMIPGVLKSNAQCTENFVEKAIGILLEKDPNAIFIVQADHGPWYWDQEKYAPTSADFDRSFGIFSAFRLPNLNIPPEIKAYLQYDPSPINNFRTIFALLAEKKPELLPYHAFFEEGFSDEVTLYRP